MSRGAHRRGPVARGLAAGSVLALAGTLMVGGTAGAAEQTAAVFAVVQEGLTVEEGAALGKAFGLPNALETTGAFSYVDTASFNAVPLTEVGEGRDESGRPVLAQALDLAALDRIKPIPAEEALRGAGRLVELAGLSPELKAEPTVSHSELTLADQHSRPTRVQALDTTVSHRFSLAGLPVTGQGARLRMTFAPDGTVSQLSHALRKVERAGEVAVISPAEASRACRALYPAGVRQQTPTLGYQFPELAATNADGKGRVATIVPQYTCNPVAETGNLAHRLVPAVADSAPSGKLTASRSGDKVEATISVSGGTEPYSYAWSSSSTVLDDARGGDSISYLRTARENAASGEQLTVEVTDANGLTATATVALDGDGDASVETVPGGGGFGVLAVGPVDVGIEQTVDEWQCAQDSANGFRNVMTSKGVPTVFDWRGHNAWEWDFKDPSLGGGDNSYVDNVDATWYTGHGSPSGFTFKSSVNDNWIVPGDSRWGNRDLEWLQLESCQVLRDTNGTHNYFSRWRQAFQGLHILNGFHTNAYCVGGGTGRSFAEYLFPKKFLWWTIRPAQRVQTAWALMAIDKEPGGVVYRSMGAYRWDGVNNIGDYFWGQGPVGPDLPITPQMGMWSISGTV
ncbi:DUF6345 domain-containing protein [Solwaraspora sp. WMMD1047]|uniref:DUF6345 domain-containing protein n=1 Tax=Solwaraspora sp. WMMD1047 TaxID=3016102 RepID=UPI002417DDEE|nr:DUF6345 domain-containing protein [Solwaraspora sp. WMMD1047]MDG4830813.1 DUF6345 domain-containing protein [Solwaraspora sp. WMMD1047]